MHPFDVWLFALQTLPDCAVLTIDRQQRRASKRRRFGNQVAGHDQRLFIGQGDGLAGCQGGDGRTESDGATRGHKQQVDLGVTGDVDEFVGAL